jgi:hypothetical protein
VSVRLTVLDERTLDGDLTPDLPVRLHLLGHYLAPVDGVEVAEIEVRLNPATLTDLVAQARAAQMDLARRARRDADTVAFAAQVAFGSRTLARNDPAVLQRVHDALQAIPHQDLPVRGGPRPARSRTGNPPGGADREYGRETPRTSEPYKPPLPRRQLGKGGP